MGCIASQWGSHVHGCRTCHRRCGRIVGNQGKDCWMAPWLCRGVKAKGNCYWRLHGSYEVKWGESWIKMSLKIRKLWSIDTRSHSPYCWLLLASPLTTWKQSSVLDSIHTSLHSHVFVVVVSQEPQNYWYLMAMMKLSFVWVDRLERSGFPSSQATNPKHLLAIAPNIHESGLKNGGYPKHCLSCYMFFMENDCLNPEISECFQRLC